MAKKAAGKNTSAAIRELLKQNPQATLKDAEAAIGKFSSTLFYILRGKMGLATKRKKRGRPKKAASKTAAVAEAAPSAKLADKGDGYLKLEQQLDALVSQADQLGDRGLAESLRNARRRASAKLIS